MSQPAGNSQHQHKNRIRLPFERRKTDWVTWCYMHRHGLLTTVIIFLMTSIVFMSTKIDIYANSTIDGIIIDMEQPVAQEKLEEQIKKMQERLDFSDVKNTVSNENAKEMTAQERRQTMQSLQNDKLLNEAEKVLEGTSSNRDRYEQGLREERQIIDAKNSKDKSDKKPQDTKVKGSVTVSFSFVNPVRSSYKLVVPAYMCEGGGEVVVNATLNRNGSVSAASIDRAASSGDECMTATALRAARESRFNVDSSAPDRHQGTITYIFIPQ